ELGFALAALVPGRRRGGRIETAAVELEREMRLDLHLALGRQRAEEGNAELEVANAVRRVYRRVGEVDRARAHHDVVHGEACGRSVALVGGRGSEAAQHVVDVVAAVAEAGEAQHRRLDIEAVYYRRETEQGADRRIGMDALDLYLRRRTIVRTGESEVVDRQLERPRIEGDVAERQATAELLRDGLFGLARDDGRHVEPRRAPDQAEHNEDDACAPHATPRYEASSRRKE